jgi:hypothetical protein
MSERFQFLAPVFLFDKGRWMLIDWLPLDCLEVPQTTGAVRFPRAEELELLVA